MSGLPLKAHRSYTVEDLAVSWGIPVPTVVGWVSDGSLKSDEYGQTTRPLILQFVNSQTGQDLLRAARI